MTRVLLAAALLLLAPAARAQSTYTLSVATSGPATPLVVVTSTPSGIVCPGTCEASFDTGTVVTLGAVWPSTVAFIVWGGAHGCGTNAPTCLVTLAGNSSVTALFDPFLSVAAVGTGLGTVSSSGAVLIGNAQNYGSGAPALVVSSAGAVVALVASTGPASSFTGWTGASGCTTSPTCVVTMNQYQAVVATFTADGVGPYALQVSVPLGGGAVVSTPTGINTGAGVFTSTFTPGTSVSFATVAAAGYTFVGWSNGGCAGRASCVVTSSSPLQGLGGNMSPAAWFFPVTP